MKHIPEPATDKSYARHVMVYTDGSHSNFRMTHNLRCKGFLLSSQQAKHAATENAFTLIELLVVVAIISLLVSILLPALSTAKDMARSALCMSNQAQIGLAHYFYAEDNQGMLIPTYGTSGKGPNWWNTLPVYYGEKSWNNPLLYCPSADDTLKEKPAYGGNRKLGYNQWVYGVPPRIEEISVAKIINIDTVGVVHAAYSPSQWTSPGSGWLDWWNSPAGFIVSDRHAGKTNVMYLDRHVESSTIKSLEDGNLW